MNASVFPDWGHNIPNLPGALRRAGASIPMAALLGSMIGCRQ